jgi:hypothetical protein
MFKECSGKMLQQGQVYLSFMENYGFMLTLQEGWSFSYGFGSQLESGIMTFQSMNASSEEDAEPDDEVAPLDDAAQSEREYVRERLREELKREPTDVELDEWLRQHTEGY